MCIARDDVLRSAEPAIEFNERAKRPLAKKASYSEKRGYGDFNCDEIEDVVEVNDEQIIGQKWEAAIFYGYKGKDGKINFKDDPVVRVLPIKCNWISSKTKLDISDLNCDCYSDVLMTQYREVIGTDKYHLHAAINIDGEKFESATGFFKEDLPLGETIIQFLEAVAEATDQSYGSKNINNYFKMDWGDIDGDGEDDLCLFWRNSHLTEPNDLYAYVWYSATEKGSNKINFSGTSEQVITGFLHDVFIKNLDVGDVNGDCKQRTTKTKSRLICTTK